jgi:cytochrome c1
MLTRRTAALLLGAFYTLLGAMPAHSAETEAPSKQRWTFSGPFGKFDRAQLQRGFKVYREVCQTCHGMSLVAFRNLAEPGGPGYTPAQAAAVAAEYKVQDGPNDKGEMFERPGRPTDRFLPVTWKNEAEARTLYNGTVPPDLSVIAKARTYERGFPWFILDAFTAYQEHGPDYIVALLKGYEEQPPQGFNLPPGTQYNKYFPGHAIAMPPPLTDGRVEYTDGTPATLDQYARDITAFLMWTAEPHLEARKRIGFQVVIFLIVFAGLLYFAKKKVWGGVPETA